MHSTAKSPPFVDFEKTNFFSKEVIIFFPKNPIFAGNLFLSVSFYANFALVCS